MKIVVLDGYTLNPGDLSWDEFETLGEFEVYDRTLPQEVLTRSKSASALLINKIVLNDTIVRQLPALEYIGVLATGYNVVDVEFAKQNNVVVTNVPAYGTKSVSQMVFALLLEITQNVALHSQSVKAGNWAKSPDWCYWEKPLIELDGLTMGIIGFGRIGREAANIANSFGMKIIANDINKVESIPEYVSMKDVDSIFSESDVISLHCQLTKENFQMVNSSKINLMKKNAILINTSRGQLVNEQDLADALNNERIAGAGLDLLSEEPPAEENPLLSAKNCFVTPHIAWATYSARKRLMEIAFENLKAYLNGNPQNVVNK